MSDDKYKSVFADNLNKLMRIKGITQTDIINDLKINEFLKNTTFIVQIITLVIIIIIILKLIF